jgi:hypothetical protein
VAAAGSCQRYALATLSLAVVVVLVGCDRVGQDISEPTPPAPTGGPSVAPVDASPDFPVTAQDYAQLTVAAWAAPDPIRLGELTTPDVREQIIALPGPPNPDWTFVRCVREQDSGSDCAFYNADGDELVLHVDHDLLGGPGATTAARYEVTSYPDEVVPYLETFVAAWQAGNVARMRNLAVAAVVEVFVELDVSTPQPSAPPGTPSISPASPPPASPPAEPVEVEYDVGGTVDRLLSVTVILPDQELSTMVSTSLLGEPHAIRSAVLGPVA